MQSPVPIPYPAPIPPKQAEDAKEKKRLALEKIRGGNKIDLLRLVEAYLCLNGLIRTRRKIALILFLLENRIVFISKNLLL